MNSRYDVAVVGSGPAGTEAALAARRLGASVALLERSAWGGTCLNEGCVPSNTLLERIDDRGPGDPQERWASATGAASRLIATLSKGLRASLVAAGVEIHSGDVVAVESGKLHLKGAARASLDATSIVLAMGAESVRPSLSGAGLPCCFTWAECLTLEEVPASVLVIAGGPLHLEAVRFFRALGSDVTLVASDLVGVSRDSEIEDFLRDQLMARGVKVLAGSVSGVELTGGSAVAHVDNGAQGSVTVDAVVFADFRVPRDVAALSPHLEHGADGYVVTRPDLSTSVPSVFACGDLIGPPFLASAARAQGLVAGEAAAGIPAAYRPDLTPVAVHGLPEVAAVGLSEAAARATRESVVVGYAEFSASARAFALREEQGVVKLVVDGSSGELLGGHVVGASATETIGLVALAMTAEFTVDDLATSSHAHPSLSELVTDAARDAVRHLS